MRNKIVTIGIIVISAFVLLFILSSKSPETKTGDTQSAQTSQSQVVGPKIAAEKVEVVYFHSSARCTTCVMAGNYVAETMKGFEKEIAEGRVVYLDINVDDPANKAIVEKYQARGSSLFIGTTINGQETTEEEVGGWRFLGNEKAFHEYLSNKVKELLGA